MFFQFNLWEKIIWCVLCWIFPISGLFCLFPPICLLIKCEIKYTCIATSPWDDPLLFVSCVKTKRWCQYFHCSLAGYAQNSTEKLKQKTNLADLPFIAFCLSSPCRINILNSCYLLRKVIKDTATFVNLNSEIGHNLPVQLGQWKGWMGWLHCAP